MTAFPRHRAEIVAALIRSKLGSAALDGMDFEVMAWPPEQPHGVRVSNGGVAAVTTMSDALACGGGGDDRTAAMYALDAFQSAVCSEMIRASFDPDGRRAAALSRINEAMLAAA